MPDAVLASLKSLLSDRDFLLTDRKCYKAQLSDQNGTCPRDFRCKNARWRKVIWSIDEQLTVIDGEIDDIIATDPGLARQREFLTSIDGVGNRIAVNMLALAGGFTRFRNARQFCSFAGLVPYKYESGTSACSRARISKQANQTMKALLHMAAVGAAPHMKAGEYKEYYERRLAEGKHVMSVLNVIRAKLVHRMVSVIRRDTEYTRQHHHTYCPYEKLLHPLQNPNILHMQKPHKIRAQPKNYALIRTTR